ncbi:Zn-ribbon domain-containing OB-fold protein [Pseudomonas brassicacearum]|jgi:Predicted nucleic-acid-binding protein containing a Zn-ribbon|nr:MULTISPECIES: zinc ribbon domain-containing protein [Pseudomonas]ARU77560.1 PhlB [synthetic construct]EIK64619.1 2,4-diacetylphloroglucinol biosynthesis protein PhlB [Pseudomonas fluorescens Q8r1-96]KAB0528245.1 2,4-diacetylphloroglucinol biosynthesis protein [Pseudomonas brassicacearum subsp. brassicacearum]NJP59553.1 2,4-diacetylphloroglucinol biosynthesis protein [Pseudomonas brassicacearum]QEO78232.1 2,4-diacetylphloroglucinol biosynthesis protein [Pseudomonas brassicacearum]
MSLYPEQIHRMTTASMLREWREHGGKYRLEGSRCQDCEEIFFPRRTVCGACNSLNVEPYRCSRTGTIQVSAHAENPILAAMGYGETVPRFMAMVRLDDGLVIASEIVDVTDPRQVVSGAPVRMVIRKHVRESNLAWQYAYKFVLVK